MILEKQKLLKKLLDQGVFPKNESIQKFLNCVKSLLTEKVAEEANLEYVSPETLSQIAATAKNFSYKMLRDWKSTKISYKADKLLASVSGEFKIVVETVGKDGQPKLPSVGRGQPRKSFMAKKVSARGLEAASIVAEGHHPRALYQVNRKKYLGLSYSKNMANIQAIF